MVIFPSQGCVEGPGGTYSGDLTFGGLWFLVCVFGRFGAFYCCCFRCPSHYAFGHHWPPLVGGVGALWFEGLPVDTLISGLRCMCAYNLLLLCFGIAFWWGVVLVLGWIDLFPTFIGGGGGECLVAHTQQHVLGV